VAIGVLVFVHELGHFAVAKRLGVLVERFSIGLRSGDPRAQGGETEYARVGDPAGRLREDARRRGGRGRRSPTRSGAFSTQSVGRRAAIVFAGPAMNLVFAFLVYSVLFAAVGVENPSTEPRVGASRPGCRPSGRASRRATDRRHRRHADRERGAALQDHRRLEGRAPAADGSSAAGPRFPLEVEPELHENRTVFNEDAGKVYRIGVEVSLDWSRVGPLTAVGMAAQQDRRGGAHGPEGPAAHAGRTGPLAGSRRSRSRSRARRASSEGRGR